MTTQRDDLAREIFIADNAGQSREASLKDWEALVAGSGTDTYAHNIADGLIAAGYTRPRTITTVEELDALAVGSVIVAKWDDGRPDYQIMRIGEGGASSGGMALLSGKAWREVSNWGSTLTVLHEGAGA